MSKTIVMTKNTENTDTVAALQAALEAMRAENAALKASKSNGLGLKVSAKHAVSVYGLGRFPVTLYKEQWEKLFDRIESIKAFIAEHADELAVKDRSVKE